MRTEKEQIPAAVKPEAIADRIASSYLVPASSIFGAEISSSPPASPRRLTMISVYEIRLTKDHYRRLAEADRALLFLTGHALNQIMVLRKVVVFSLNHDPSQEIERMVTAGQAQVLYRLLLGMIEETWQMVRNHGTTINAYQSLLDPEAAEAYVSLKKHFGKSNLLNKIRNTLTFHYPSADQINEAFERVSDDNHWNIYPSESYLNSFYLTSETVVASAIMNVTGEEEIEAAWGKVVDAMVLASNDLLAFLTSLMRAIYTKNFGEQALRGAEVQIGEAQQFSEVSFPFFVVDDRGIGDEPAQVRT